ncbi:MAG: iron ABC transporter permease [Flavobacteriales bacterium]|nr:iron ABC transporter permease [Flavobacteriales bacterium]
MIQSQRINWFLVVSLLIFPLIAYFHLTVGQQAISISDFKNAIFAYDSTNTAQLLAREFRFPRLIMACVAGAGLSLAGMLMQTLFNNPLAGPYVLGINSGASLMVAISLLTGIQFFGTNFGLISTALIGAFAAGILMMSVVGFLKSQVSLLLVGLMFGSFTSAIVSFLEISSKAEQLKSFTLWSMGSLQNVLLEQIPLILLFFVFGIILSALIVKPLNLLVLGENAASLLGLKIQQTRIVILIITALFTGLITAFCGPIAFVGLAVPNITRILLKTQNHFHLIAGNLLIGSSFLLLCDILIQLIENEIQLPINVLTSLIGAPFVIFVLIRKMK